MRRLLPLLALAALLACDDDDGGGVVDARTDAGPVEDDAEVLTDGPPTDGPLDAAEPPPDGLVPDVAALGDVRVAPDGAAPDAAEPADGGAVEPVACPLDDFVPCGGDLEGEWRLLDFCTAAGAASEPRECEGPGEDEAACQGGVNERTCALQYGGTATFAAGQLTARFSVAIAARYVFDDPCLAALRPGESPADACATFASDRLHCDYGAGACRCEAQSEPESDENRVAYAVDGDAITIGGAPGRFCAGARRLAIRFDQRGPEGWQGWTLLR